MIKHTQPLSTNGPQTVKIGDVAKPAATKEAQVSRPPEQTKGPQAVRLGDGGRHASTKGPQTVKIGDSGRS